MMTATSQPAVINLAQDASRAVILSRRRRISVFRPTLHERSGEGTNRKGTASAVPQKANEEPGFSP
jgi:hypothetical protein